MSSTPSAPRRSQRDKKPAKAFTTVTTAGKKRKHVDSENEETGGNVQVDDGEAEPDAYDDEEEAPKRKATKKKAPAAKKPRIAKAPATRKTRKAGAEDALFDPEKLAKDTKINSDNPLFNAVINPAAALQATAEDFLESLNQEAGSALAELVNLILRSCGSNDTVNADEAVDYDGVVDTLDNFTEGLKKDNSPTYPLTSKLAVFKKFRAHLSEFISRLITSSAELGSLYTSDLVTTLTTWVVAMSSSQIRSFRHTATVIALETQAALCDVARSVEKEVEVVGRQREGEKKRRTKAANKDKGLTAREKELENKSREVNSRKEKLGEYINEFIDAVFIHRYRDLDPIIRTECISSLGLYFKKYPSHFLNNSYLRYVGWVLSDAATSVRLAAVKSLGIVYALSSSSGEAEHALTSLNHFTERFKPRLLDMAEGDTDISVRVGVLGVLVEIDRAGLLEEDERERLGALVFCEDAKVRKGVAPFVKGVWEEWCEERMNELGDGAISNKGKSKSKKKGNPDSDRIGIKGLAALLVKWGDALDKILGDDEESEDGSDEDASKRARRLAAFVAPTESRIALAIDALWDRVEPANNWEGVLDVLLLDHSAVGEEGLSPSRSRKGKGKPNGKKRTDDDEEDDDSESIQVDDTWRLEEVEEGVLLEVLVASVRRATKEAPLAAKKSEEESVVNDITRALIKALPRLFIKYQTDEKRILQVLVLPTFMNLDLYLEMRMLNGYATLWDDVIKQFTTHTSQSVLGVGCRTIAFFMQAASLSNTNSTKVLELEDELSSSLRDTVAGRDEIEVVSFNEDEIHSLAALCLRLQELAGIRDMTSWVEENEGGKQSSAWDILCALAERGRLGYKEEEAMVENALRFLYLHIMWKLRSMNLTTSPSSEEQETLKEQRDLLMEKLVEYAIGTQSNTVEGVKRTSFKCLVDLYVLFTSWQKVNADGSPLATASVPLVMDDEVQYRCAGYVQAEIERYADSLTPEKGKPDHATDEEGSDEEDISTKRKKRTKDTEESVEEVDMTSRSRLEQEYNFIDVLSTFLRAIHAGVIHLRHGGILLAHYGRLGSAFDACLKVIVDVLREDGTINKEGELVVSIVTRALQEAFTLVIDDTVHDESNATQLAKLLASSFVVRGSQLAVIRRLEGEHIVKIHLNLLTWIGKHLAQYQSNGQNGLLKKAILFFRVLTPLLSNVQSRDALRIKAHVEQIIGQAKVEVSSTSQLWEPYRAYEKRLNAVMTKDKASKGRKAKSTKGGAVSSEDEGEETEIEKLVDDGPDVEPPSHPAPKRTPRPRRKAAALGGDGSPPQEGSDPVTPKPRPKPKPRPVKAKNKSPTKTDKASPTKEPQQEQALSSPPMNGLASPQKARKRARSEVDDEDEVDRGAGKPSEDLFSDSGQQPDDLPSATPAADMIIRRKRIRH